VFKKTTYDLRYNGLRIMWSEEQEEYKGGTGKSIWKSVEELRFGTLKTRRSNINVLLNKLNTTGLHGVTNLKTLI